MAFDLGWDSGYSPKDYKKDNLNKIGKAVADMLSVSSETLSTDKDAYISIIRDLKLNIVTNTDERCQ